MKTPKPRYLSVGAAEIHQLQPELVGKATPARRRRSLRRCVQHHLATFVAYSHRPGKWKYAEGEARAKCSTCGNDLFVGVTLTETTAIVVHGCMQGLEDCKTPSKAAVRITANKSKANILVHSTSKV